METVTLGLVLMLFIEMSRTEHLTCKGQSLLPQIATHSGATVQLPCLFDWQGRHPTEYTLVWKFIRRDEELMAYGWDSQSENPESNSRFMNRTGVRRHWFAEGNATLTLGNLALSDGGSYICQVTTMEPHERGTCAEVTLSVKKGHGNTRGNAGKQQGQWNSTPQQPGGATEQAPNPGKRSGVQNGSSRTRSPVLLHFSQVLILLFLVLSMS